MAFNTEKIKNEMEKYSELWKQHHPDVSQTELFRKIIPDEPVDFTDTFKQNKLNEIFTGDRLRTCEGFNCNHLYRDIQKEAEIIIYDSRYLKVIHPLGMPGRDIHKLKVSHLMGVSNSKDGPIDFNIMLPSTSDELKDIYERMEVIGVAVQNLKNNVPVSECGPAVIAKAEKKGFPLDKGIRDFFAEQIVSMDENVRNGPPGYTLENSVGSDISSDLDLVKNEIEKAFTTENVFPKLFIQGPNRNTQILSHIHCFMISNSQDGLSFSDEYSVLDENYISVNEIYEIKKKFLM